MRRPPSSNWYVSMRGCSAAGMDHGSCAMEGISGCTQLDYNPCLLSMQGCAVCRNASHPPSSALQQRCFVPFVPVEALPRVAEKIEELDGSVLRTSLYACMEEECASEPGSHASLCASTLLLQEERGGWGLSKLAH
eukprot:scaffold252042_cov24-Tisochrysis_lutea.AAC.1